MVEKTGNRLAVAGEAFSRQIRRCPAQGQPALLAAINEAIAKLARRRHAQELSEKWFGAGRHARSRAAGSWSSTPCPSCSRGAWWTVVLSLSGCSSARCWLRSGAAAAVRVLAAAVAGEGHVSFFRGTPLLVQLFMIYYGLPQLGIQLDPLPAALIGFSLNMAAYTAEILRAAIAFHRPGQWEAAASIGMGRAQTCTGPSCRRPHAPPCPLGNSFISLVKRHRLAATIRAGAVPPGAADHRAHVRDLHHNPPLRSSTGCWPACWRTSVTLEHRVNRHEQDA